MDFSLPPDRIAEELTSIARHPYLNRVAQAAQPVDLIEQPASKFSEIFALIRATVGVDFSHYKLTTIRRRIARRMLLHKTSSLDEYIIILRKNADEVDALHQDFLINLTSFFRDPEAFEELQKRFLPKILKDRPPESPLRVWVPGCATGEEVYSIAVCLMETLGEVRTKPPAQIFATDISERAVRKAREGLYPETIAADVSSERLRRFFLRSEGGYQIRKPLRELCVFAPQNLFMDPPFSRMDLISCRNVLIYLGTALQERVLNTLHYALKPSGILLLGVSETTSATPHLFQPEDAGLKFYSKRPAADRLGFDFARQSGPFDLQKVPHEKGAKIRETDIEEEIDQIVLKLCSPAGVVVNEAMDVVLFRGQTNPFLQPPPGKPTFNILKMAHRDLVLDLRTLIHQARDSAAVVKREGVELRFDGQCKQLNLIAVPLTTRENRCMVLFEETTQKPAAQRQTAPGKTDGRKKKRAEEDLEIASIRGELAETKRTLQAIIQEQETSNEELRSANEEILSSNEELHCTNEELQTAKEELQASIEELRTVNQELQNRNAELTQVNNDLSNLLASVDVGIVMLGSDMRIRHFTPTAAKVLNFIPADIGRPIGNIRPNLKLEDLEGLVADVLDSLAVKEVEVQDSGGQWFSVRIRPYRTADNKIDGTVIVLVDIDELKRTLVDIETYKRTEG